MSITINKLARRVIEFKYRNAGKSENISFSNLSSSHKSCLICMPSKLDLIKPASEILPDIAATFPNRSIRILLTSNVDPQSHELIKKFVVIKPLAYDLDRFSLPKQSFINRVAEGGIAVAIDMDTTPNFFNAILSLKAGAIIRTAFDKGVGLPYYNFILGIPSAEAAPKVSYKAMADILSNFRN